MSFYRCLFCGGKIEEYDEDELIYSYEPTKNEIKKSETNIEDSDYQYIICVNCKDKADN